MGSKMQLCASFMMSEQCKKEAFLLILKQSQYFQKKDDLRVL